MQVEPEQRLRADLDRRSRGRGIIDGVATPGRTSELGRSEAVEPAEGGVTEQLFER